MVGVGQHLGLGAAHQRAERRVHLHEAAVEGAQGHADRVVGEGVVQHPFRRGPAPLGGPAVGDVPDGEDQAAEPLVLEPVGGNQFDVGPRARARADPDLDRIAGPVGPREHRVEGAKGQPQVVGMQEVHHGLTAPGVEVIAEERLGGRVRVEEDSRLVEDRDDVGRRLHEEGQPAVIHWSWFGTHGLTRRSEPARTDHSRSSIAVSGSGQTGQAGREIMRP